MRTDVQVLVADSDSYYATWVASELQGLLGVSVARAASGGEAAAMLYNEPFSACVLNYKLTDMTGLAAIPLIRGRRPDVPIVMTSDQASDSIAFASLHAGAIEYVPKQKDHAQQLAGLLRRVLDGSYEPARPVGQAAQAEALAPTYQNRLRIVGQELDLRGCRSMTLCEVAAGFVVCAVAGDELEQSALEFLDADFSAFAARALAHRGSARGEGRRPGHKLLPGGYGDFLRALGHRLDRERCRAVTITEFPSMAGVTGFSGGVGPATASRFEWYLKSNDIRKLVEEARKRARKPRS